MRKAALLCVVAMLVGGPVFGMVVIDDFHNQINPSYGWTYDSGFNSTSPSFNAFGDSNAVMTGTPTADNSIVRYRKATYIPADATAFNIQHYTSHSNMYYVEFSIAQESGGDGDPTTFNSGAGWSSIPASSGTSSVNISGLGAIDGVKIHTRQPGSGTIDQVLQSIGYTAPSAGKPRAAIEYAFDAGNPVPDMEAPPRNPDSPATNANNADPAKRPALVGPYQNPFGPSNGGAAYFDGTNDFLLADSTTETNNIDHAFTLHATIRAEDDTRRQDLIEKWGPQRGMAFLLNYTGGTLKPAFWISSDGSDPPNSGTQWQMQSNYVIKKDVNYDLAAVFSANQKMEIYVDGQLVASETNPANVPDALNIVPYPMILGAYKDGTGSRFKGFMDNVQVFDYALVRDEIRELTTRDPIIFYDFGEGALPVIDRGTGPQTNMPTAVGSPAYAPAPPGIGGGTALDLDFGDRVLTSGAPAELSEIGDQFTVAAYVYLNQLDTVQRCTPLSRMGDSGLRGWSAEIKPDGTLQMVMSPNGSSLSWYSSTDPSQPKVTPGAWHHVVYVFDGDDFIRMYVDGQVAVDITSGVIADSFQPNVPLSIGGWSSGGITFLDGLVDRVMLFDYALTDRQVGALLVPEPGTLALLGIGLAAVARRRRRAR